MMKNRPFQKISLILGAVLALAACTPHEFPVPAGGSEGRDYPVQLVFSDGMPALRTISATKADGTAAPLRARYNVQVFRYVGEFQYGLDPDYSFTFTRPGWEDLDTTVFLPVDPAHYKVAVWTDLVVTDGSPAYDATDFEAVSYAESFGTGPRDAFFGTVDLDLSDSATGAPKPLELVRPVACIRFILPEALTFLSGRNLDAAAVVSTLRYTTALPEGFNLFLRRNRATRAAGASFTSTASLDFDGNLVFCTDHVLAGDVESNVGVDFTVRDASGNALYRYTGDVPVLRGRVTTVTFKSSGGTDPDDPTDKTGGIGIDPGFDGEIEIEIGN